jgi:hypothetical protein
VNFDFSVLIVLIKKISPKLMAMKYLIVN